MRKPSLLREASTRRSHLVPVSGRKLVVEVFHSTLCSFQQEGSYIMKGGLMGYDQHRATLVSLLPPLWFLFHRYIRRWQSKKVHYIQNSVACSGSIKSALLSQQIRTRCVDDIRSGETSILDLPCSDYDTLAGASKKHIVVLRPLFECLPPPTKKAATKSRMRMNAVDNLITIR